MKRKILSAMLLAAITTTGAIASDETNSEIITLKICNKYLEKADQALNMSMEIDSLSSVAKIQLKAGYALEATALMQRYEICKRNLPLFK